MTQPGTLCSNLTEDALVEFGRTLAPALSAGDCLLLTGDLGAGKSVLARAIIQALLPTPEGIPSPTFTLVQTYDATDFEIWHSDLYRLNDISQIDELGLIEAFETTLCLIEWPALLGDYAPENALWITLTQDGDTSLRNVALHSKAPKWQKWLAAYD